MQDFKFVWGGFIYGMAYGLNISIGILGTTYHRLKKSAFGSLNFAGLHFFRAAGLGLGFRAEGTRFRG